MRYPIVVDVPPFLYNARDGKRYAVSGKHWIEVPISTMFSDLPNYMVWAAPEIPDTTPERSWVVDGSGGKKYTVKTTGGNWTCTCPGYGWRRKCRHIEAKRAQDR
jgi:hypothetical protein